MPDPRCLRFWPAVLVLLGGLFGLGCTDEEPQAHLQTAAAQLASDTSTVADTSASAPSTGPDTTGASDSGSERTWADRQLAEMTLDEKIGQLFMVRMDGSFENAEASTYRTLVDLVENFEAGGILFGPGTPMAQITQVNDLQERAERPLLISQDTEYGVGMRIDEATRFPPAMALGAARDPSLSYRVGYATAREARALGVHQLYAPVADVNNNPDNPIINTRSFGEEPSRVGAMAGAFIQGAQDGRTVATAKHFPGHGDTDVDSHLDLPVLRFDWARLDSLELMPFRQTMEAGVESIMTGHLALPALEPDSSVPASLSPAITGGLLRDSLGFDGLIVTDALNMRGVTKNFGPGEAAVRILESGADQILMSRDPHIARAAVREALEEGRLTMETIDASVRRVLEAKQGLNLQENRQVSLDTTRHQVSTRRNEVLASTIARRSLTLLRNEGDLLPLTPPAKRDVLVVTFNDGDSPRVGSSFIRALDDRPAVDKITTRRIDDRSDEADVEEYLERAGEHDLVVVPTHLQVQAWGGDLGMSGHHEAFLEGVIEDGPPTALVAFGNPYVPSDLDPAPEAVLAAYGSGTHSQRAAAQALVGAAGTPGQLPVTVPGLADAGEGLSQPQVAPREDHPESVGMTAEPLAQIDSVLRRGVLDRAFPGAAVSVGRGPVITKHDTYGYYTYDRTKAVTSSSPFDLASLTKVVATTTAAMLLVEDGHLDLDEPVATYLPAFAQAGKEGVTVRQLLSHSSGLPAYLGPDRRGDTPEALVDTIMATPPEYTPGTQSTYSGLGMITLLRIVETITDQPFDDFCRERIFDPLGMHDTGFRSVNTSDPSYVVPTLDSTGYRGSVHDPMARVMDGVSGNAGLFSTVEDLTRFATMMANEGELYGHQFLEAETIEEFTAQAEVPGSTRALGWDTKSPEGYSSAGDAFGTGSFGHTGYTGTSLWIDPEQDLYVLLLTNRTYPEDSDERIQSIRPEVANRAYRSIVGAPRPLLPGTPPPASSDP
ncbi:MAG: glycoside hydrolase family 3 N-terminal domain-containing protein [Salinibacter sp.]